MMYLAVRTTLCSALRFEAKQLPYQALMQEALDVTAVKPFEDLTTHGKYFQPSEGQNVLLCPLHDSLGVLGPC